MLKWPKQQLAQIIRVFSSHRDAQFKFRAHFGKLAVIGSIKIKEELKLTQIKTFRRASDLMSFVQFRRRRRRRW